MLKNNKGVTLVSLVVTIIILLILAGISISSVVGDNGLLNKATTSKTATEKKEEEEQLQIMLNNYAANELTMEETTLKEYLDEKKINGELTEVKEKIGSNGKKTIEVTVKKHPIIVDVDKCEVIENEGTQQSGDGESGT